MEMEQKILLNELVQGKEFTEQLREKIRHLSSPEERQLLVEKILSCYEKALSLLNWEKINKNSSLYSPICSDFGEQECADNNSAKNVYKKRKIEPRWTENVGGPVDDGFNWRKYGQKDILGAKFPRNYYRCTHRRSQGCLATKQVQRADRDPTTFEVTYIGRHTCFQHSSPRDKSKSNKNTFDQFEVEQHEEKPKPKPIMLNQRSFNFKDEIKIQELEPVDDIFPSFSFHDEHDNIFMVENNLLGSFSPAFTSSDFSASPSRMCSLGLDCNERTPEPDSNPTSVNNSPTGEWDISIDFAGFEVDFPLEEPELHS